MPGTSGHTRRGVVMGNPASAVRVSVGEVHIVVALCQVQAHRHRSRCRGGGCLIQGHGQDGGPQGRALGHGCIAVSLKLLAPVGQPWSPDAFPTAHQHGEQYNRPSFACRSTHHTCNSCLGHATSFSMIRSAGASIPCRLRAARSAGLHASGPSADRAFSPASQGGTSEVTACLSSSAAAVRTSLMDSSMAVVWFLSRCHCWLHCSARRSVDLCTAQVRSGRGGCRDVTRERRWIFAALDLFVCGGPCSQRDRQALLFPCNGCVSLFCGTD